MIYTACQKYCVRFLFLLTIFCFGFLSQSIAQFYNGYQMQFGKNRVQYNERFWSYYKFKNFDTYFYRGGSELASFAGQIAPKELDQLEKFLDYRLDGRVQFIIYNKLSEAKQSNIGLETEEQSNNTGGLTRIVGNKIFLYFNGDHQQFREQIRAGLARILIEQIMYGGDFKDRIQNSAFLYLPEWYQNGLISYLSRDWNTDLDNKMRDGINSGHYLKLNHLTREDAVVVGHSVWKYIIETYGENAVPNLVYMTRINRNAESGFIYVLGLTFKSLADNWKEATSRIYKGSDEGLSIPSESSLSFKSKPKIVYNQAKLSSNGKHLAYVSNYLGRYKVILKNLEKNKTKKIKRGGFKSYIQQTDDSYPLLAWHPSGKLLALIRERKGKIFLGFYNLDLKKYEESELFNFDKILDFSYSDDGKLLVLSAIQKGQSDIFVYSLRSRTYEQVTKDVYDDFTPRFINQSKAILFSSNRTNDTLFFDSKNSLPASTTTDIFYYDFIGRNSILKRVTNTPAVNETKPVTVDSASFAYLSDETGIVNRYIATLDSALSYVDTTEHYRLVVKSFLHSNYARNIYGHDFSSNGDKLTQTIYHNGRLNIYVEDAILSEANTPSSPKSTIYRAETLDKRSGRPQIKQETSSLFDSLKSVPEIQQVLDFPEVVKENKTIDSNSVDTDNYVFQDVLPKSKQKKKAADLIPDSTVKNLLVSVANKPKADTAEFVLPPQRNYELAFSSDYFVLQLDNSLLNMTYQAFTGGGPYFNSGLNGFVKMGITDLMEDYRFTGGFKLSGDLNSNEYFVGYEDLRKRLDKQISCYRQARFLTNGFVSAKVHTHELRYLNKWPFSDVASVRGSVAYRNDRLVYLSTDNLTLKEPNQYLHWANARFEFVFDNTLNTGLNLYNGTRMKVFGEYYKQVNISPSGMYVIGVDARHYLKIHRQLIWANRFAASKSFGQEKLIYYMGATDNWIAPDFNYDTPIDNTENYAYQAIATNMRGFDQNIRNGNTFALINSEIRFPIFSYLFTRPIKSDFIRNFQIVGFGDVGTAWNGKSPYDSTSALNNRTISQGPFTITLISQHEPVVGGYGFGLRSRIIGYFIRADWAWGVEDGQIQDHKFYLSLSLDF